MFIAFSLEALAFFAVIFFAKDPISFVLLTGLVFFFWGEIFSLFPAVCADTYGSKFQSVNYGLLYTAKGVAALLVPFASMLKDATGSWSYVFLVVVLFNGIAALLALFLKCLSEAARDERRLKQQLVPQTAAIAVLWTWGHV